MLRWIIRKLSIRGKIIAITMITSLVAVVVACALFIWYDVDSFKKKMKEVSDKVSELTVQIVDGEEKALVARVSYQDGIAELHLDDATAPASAAVK